MNKNATLLIMRMMHESRKIAFQQFLKGAVTVAKNGGLY